MLTVRQILLERLYKRLTPLERDKAFWREHYARLERMRRGEPEPREVMDLIRQLYDVPPN